MSVRVHLDSEDPRTLASSHRAIVYRQLTVSSRDVGHSPCSSPSNLLAFLALGDRPDDTLLREWHLVRVVDARASHPKEKSMSGRWPKSALLFVVGFFLGGLSQQRGGVRPSPVMERWPGQARHLRVRGCHYPPGSIHLRATGGTNRHLRQRRHAVGRAAHLHPVRLRHRSASRHGGPSSRVESPGAVPDDPQRQPRGDWGNSRWRMSRRSWQSPTAG